MILVEIHFYSNTAYGVLTKHLWCKSNGVMLPLIFSTPTLASRGSPKILAIYCLSCVVNLKTRFFHTELTQILALHIILTVLNTHVNILTSADPYFIHTADIKL